jgi:hypothetical protein
MTAVSIAEERWDEKMESAKCKVKNERVEVYLNKRGFRRILAATNSKKEDYPGGNIRHEEIHG